MPLDFCINQTNRRQPKPDSQKGSMVWCCWICEEKQSLKQKHTSFAILQMSAQIMTFFAVDFVPFWCTGMVMDPRWRLSLQVALSSWETQKAHSSKSLPHFTQQMPETFKSQGTHQAGLQFGDVSGAWRLLRKLRAGWGSPAAALVVQCQDWNQITPPTTTRI